MELASASDVGSEVSNLSDFAAQRSPGLALHISDSVLAHQMKVDNTVRIGALASHLAENKVTQSFSMVTDMQPNIVSLWKKVRLCMRAVILNSEKEILDSVEK